jgi:hypothetical protein
LFERLLAAKSKTIERQEGSMPCIEIALMDVLSSRCLLSGESVQAGNATPTAF